MKESARARFARRESDMPPQRSGALCEDASRAREESRRLLTDRGVDRSMYAVFSGLNGNPTLDSSIFHAASLTLARHTSVDVGHSYWDNLSQQGEKGGKACQSITFPRA